MPAPNVDQARINVGRSHNATDARTGAVDASGSTPANAASQGVIADCNAHRAGAVFDTPTCPSVVSILALIWAVVTLAIILWLAQGALAVRRIVRRSHPLDAPAWRAPLFEIADRFGLAAAPRLVRSTDVKMPFACGLLRPTIVLPAESDQWTVDRRRAVLLHELGHVRRRDLVGHTVARLACALYWFHPLVWTAARRLRAESERACDDLALTCGERATITRSTCLTSSPVCGATDARRGPRDGAT